MKQYEESCVSVHLVVKNFKKAYRAARFINNSVCYPSPSFVMSSSMQPSAVQLASLRILLCDNVRAAFDDLPEDFDPNNRSARPVIHMWARNFARQFVSFFASMCH